MRGRAQRGQQYASAFGRRTIGFAVDVLDDGLRLYRRHFGRFVLLAALMLMPLVLLTRLVIWIGQSGSNTWIWALMLAWLPISLLLAVYWIGGLSRATATALGGQPIDVRGALAIAPRRILACGSYALLRSLRVIGYYLIAGISAAIGPLFLLSALLGALLHLSSATLWLLATVYTLRFWLFGAGMLVIVLSMALANTVFGLQQWFQDQYAPVAHQPDSSIWHGGDSEGMFFVAALTVLCLSAIIGVSLTMVLALPVWSVPAGLGALPWIGAIVAAVLVLPLLPIWMALVYRKLAADADGGELGSRIAVWRGSIGA